MSATSKINTRSAAFKNNQQSYSGMLATLRERMAWAVRGGGDKLVQRHIARGKLPVRERIDLLLDVGSPFLEIAPLAGWGLYNNEVPSAGAVAGIGIVEGQHCMVIANDATVKGGSFFKETVRKHVRAQEIDLGMVRVAAVAQKGQRVLVFRVVRGAQQLHAEHLGVKVNCVGLNRSVTRLPSGA